MPCSLVDIYIYDRFGVLSRLHLQCRKSLTEYGSSKFLFSTGKLLHGVTSEKMVLIITGMGTSNLTTLVCYLSSHSGWARNLHEGNNFCVAEWQKENVMLKYRIYTDLNISTLHVQDHVLNVHICMQTVAVKSPEYGKPTCLFS